MNKNRFIKIKYQDKEKIYNVPKNLPKTQSWFFCALIFDSIKGIEVEWVNFHPSSYNSNLKNLGMIEYDKIIKKINNYLNIDATNFIEKYCKNEKWFHPSGINQEMILNNSKVKIEADILCSLIIFS